MISCLQVRQRAVDRLSRAAALRRGTKFPELQDRKDRRDLAARVEDGAGMGGDQKETRSFIKLNLVALAFTLAGFAAFLLAIPSIIVLPLILSPLGLGSLTETLTRVARWPVLLIVLLIGLAVLYRCGPDRRAARWQWGTVGSIFAAVTWIIASFLFSWYLASFTNYNATYGSLGAAVGVMIWLWISTTVMLLGAPSSTLKLSIRPREIRPSARSSL